MNVSTDTTSSAPIDESLRRRFEKAWRHGRPAPIEAFMPAESSPYFLATLEELVVIDLEMRWRTTPSLDHVTAKETPVERPRLEEYLDRFSALRQVDILRRLVNAEYRIRHLFGDRPAAADYVSRFPEVVRTSADLDTALPERRSGEAPWPSIDGYDILGVLGKGGMAIVYKAWQRRLNREVAVKTILPGNVADFEDLVRFMNEAESMARLQHPYIIQIFEVNQQDGRPFICMEFVAGGSLADHLKGAAPTAARTAAQFVERVARGVACAHRRGIVHRDLKPANILLQSVGDRTEIPPETGNASTRSSAPTDLLFAVPKVTDFGLAKHVDSGVGLTQTGAVLGTPSYMAPEQAAGKSQLVRPATDVHALGAILYELLTGRPPFQAATILDTLEQVRTQEPVPPSRLQLKVPRDLETICLKCLEKEPGRRYATAAAMAEDLGRFLGGEPIKARPVSNMQRLGRWCRRNPVVAGLSATLALLLLGGAVAASLTALHLDRVAKNESAQRKEAERQHTEAERARKEMERALAEMYTGSGLTAHDRGDPAEAFLWFASCARLERSTPETMLANRVRFRTWSRLLPVPLRALPHAGDVRHFAFHPKGTHLLTIDAEGRLRIWDLEEEETIPWEEPKSPVNCACWNLDGSTLIVGTSMGGEVRGFPAGDIVSMLDAPGGIQALALSPAGDRLALCGRAARVWDLAKKEYVTPELVPSQSALTVAFNPDGNRIVAGCQDGKARVFTLADAAGKEPKIFPHRLIKERFSSKVMSPIFLEGGKELLTVLTDGELGWWNVATGKLIRRVKFSTPGFNPLVLALGASPDRTRFAIGGYNGARIWDVQAANELEAVLSHVNYVTAMDVSPDGRTLLTASEDRTSRLWSMADGQPLGPPLGHQASLRHAGFSPDGGRFVTVQNDGLVRVWAMPRGHPRDHVLTTTSLLTDVRIDPLGRYAMASGAGWRDTGDTKQSTRVFEISTGEPAGPLLAIGGVLVNAALAPHTPQALTLCSLAPTRAERDAVRLAPEGKAGRARFWNWRTGEALFEPIAMPSEPRGAAYSPDGKHAAVICTGGQILLLDPITGKVTGRFEHGSFGAQNAYPGLLFTADGTTLISFGSNELVRVWDLATARERFPPLAHDRITYHAALSSDGRWLVTGAWDDTARVWDMESGANLAILRHPDWVFSAWFDKSDNRVLTACRDGMARVWNWRTGELLHPPCRHKDAVFNASFTPDEKFIVTACRDGTARMWETTTGRQVAPSFVLRSGQWSFGNSSPKDRFKTTWNACMTPDGSYAVVCGDSRCLYAIDLGDLADRPDPDDPPLEDPVLLGQLLSGRRVVDERDVEGLTTAQWLERWTQFRGRNPEFGKAKR
jgi:eukaryotic-like serine/threonine-protein kinase